MSDQLPCKTCGHYAIACEDASLAYREELARVTKERDLHLGLRKLGWSAGECAVCGAVMAGPMSREAQDVAKDLARVTAENEALRKERDNALRERSSYPARCPITQAPFFMTIEHPEDGWVPTYGGPFDSYTIPTWRGEEGKPWQEGEFTRHRYDHDAGGWTDDEYVSLKIIHEETLFALEDAAIKEGS